MDKEVLEQPVDNPVNEQETLPEQPSSTKGLVIAGLGFLLVVMGVIVFYFLREQETLHTSLPLPTNESDTVVVNEEIEDTPFKEMTIPYLRSREYTSQLGELSQSAENARYTSYLTSYDSDGLNINGLLTIPSGVAPAGGWPGIIFIHGYIPPSVYQTNSESYSAYVDYLARNGFAVFKIDLRGHGNSDGEASGAYYSSDYIIDALNARAALANSDIVNADRIGLWGHSMAGNVVMRSIAAAQDIPAAVIWAGAVYTYEDWEEYGLDDNSYRPPTDNTERQRRRQELFDTHGEFSPASEFWKTVVPVNYLDGVATAMQLNHAVDDSVVNVGYSRGLATILEERGMQHEMHEYPSGGHNISGGAFTQAMQNTLRFYQEHL